MPGRRLIAKRFPGLVLFLSLLLLMSSPVAFAATGNSVAPGSPVSSNRAIVSLLIKSGALDLAIQAIDKDQGKTIDKDWESWERLRYSLYFKRQAWEQLQKRYAAYPDDLPEAFRTWATEQVARTYLFQGEGEKARVYLRSLVWHPGSSRKQLAVWRQLIIESYLGENRVGDADLALIQYQRDYPGRSPAWQILRGRVLILKKDYRGAFDVLSGVQSLEARLYRLYAALKAGIYQPAVVIKSAQRITDLKYASQNLKMKAWVLVSHAAAKDNNSRLKIKALESAFNTHLDSVSSHSILAAVPDDLWQAYFDYSEFLGNRNRLLVGDDSSWVKQAETLEKKKQFALARAVYAFEAVKGSVDIMREIAHKRLTDLLYKDEMGEVAVALYSRGTRAGPIEALPDTVRYRLAIEILRGGNIKLAAKIMKTLKQPPAEESVQDWKLRRARTMVYAGQFQDASGLMQQVLENNAQLDDDYIRRFTQVVFDLQAVGEHKAALSLLERLYHKTKTIELQRELLFWMAESNTALGNSSEAAELYLRSAYLGQPKGGDMWGQSARYHAAESLARAGNLDDARTIYQELLRFTPDAKRRAIIERNLQQLWLRKQTTQAVDKQDQPPADPNDTAESAR
jgi:tetratricopeptide (TPR) repeat protein